MKKLNKHSLPELESQCLWLIHVWMRCQLVILIWHFAGIINKMYFMALSIDDADDDD